MSTVARVAFPLPLSEAIDYLPPAGIPLQAGVRVAADLQGRERLGLIVELIDVAEREGLKPLTRLLDTEPVVSEALLKLLRWVASYYEAPLGEALRLALPAGLLTPESYDISLTPQARQLLAGLPGLVGSALDEKARAQLLRRLRLLPESGRTSLQGFLRETRLSQAAVEALQREGWVELIAQSHQPRARHVTVYSPEKPPEEAAKLLKRAPTQAALYAALAAMGEATREDLPDHPGAAWRALVARGFVRTEERESLRTGLSSHRLHTPDVTYALRPAQEAAVRAITAALGELPHHQAFLLEGPPGSGKTDVYLGALEAAYQAGKGALLLVPEIALTPQLASRVAARFGPDVAIWHSNLAVGERYDEWRRLRAGAVRLVVGTRSAVFAPVPDLGLIVVDEEHDASYKSEEGVTYHARDVAMIRARAEGALVLLGSATPSVETMAQALRGRLTRLVLPRPEGLVPPARVLVDVGRSRTTSRSRLSAELILAIQTRLERREQTILFLNRRGYAPVVQCGACREIVTCRQCAVSLTYHRHLGKLMCHTCGGQTLIPESCPHCGASDLALLGVGTERIEDELLEHFPQARIERLDRDRLAAKGMLADIVERMRTGALDILVGTSLVTKGHDFPGVTLVGVLDGDRSLNVPDFRAYERTYQLLVQVAGRAGRADKPGEVYIQTTRPEHDLFATLDDPARFYAGELAARRDLYPPFRRLALIRVESEDFDEAVLRASRVRQGLDELQARGTAAEVELLGPAPPPIGQVRGYWRQHILLRAAAPAPLHALIEAARRARLFGDTRSSRLRLDIDPQRLA